MLYVILMETSGEHLYGMKKPKNMTEQEVLEKINIVVDRIAPKYTFNGYDVDDIKQEAFLICMDALNRYDQKRPLENFLAVNLSNRLKNFVRDNYFTKKDEDKKKALNPTHLAYDDALPSEEVDTDTIFDAHEMKKIIDQFLPKDLRTDYLKIISDVYVPKKRKEYIITTLRNILKENGYEKG